MRRQVRRWAVAVGILMGSGLAVCAQTPAPLQTGQSAAVSDSSAQAPSHLSESASGGKLHGVVKSGITPLPGVTVTAQNTLTGKRYSTTTGINGAWSLTIPVNGRYVVRTQFAAFAQGSAEAQLNAASHDQAVNLDLMLASRAEQQEKQQGDQQVPGALSAEAMQAIRQLASNGAQNLNLMSALTGDTETQNGAAGAAGAALPAIAGNSDFSGDSVAISGQTGQVSPMAGMDMDRIRDAIESLRAQGALPGAQVGGLLGGGGFGSLGGGFGGPGGFGGGGSGGGRMSFRNFNPGQPHGAIFWTGSNSALDALPFALSGQPQIRPASGTNRFGITFMSAPYLPHLTKPSGKDTFFLTFSGSRNSNPLDEYAAVPTDAERTGDFSASGLPAIYDPTTGLQFQDSVTGKLNAIPAARIANAATALLCPSAGSVGINCKLYFPEPNLASATANGYNYHLLTTAQANTSQASIRYMRALGKNATLLGGRGGGGGRRSQTNQGLRQSINANYNWSHNAQDDVNLFPRLGGNSSTDGESVQAGYTVGYKKVTSIFNASWNRSNAKTLNYFTNGADVATEVGVLGPGGVPLNSSPLDYGLPSITLGQYAGLSQQQPNFALTQTISFSETLSCIHDKHNLRFGGDYRRVHRDFLGGSNSTGSFTFSGKFTRDPAGTQGTGSALADFLLGLPQETTIDVAAEKSYLRENVMDIFALDDWRVRPSLTLNYGIRYEFFAPFTEKYGHLAFVDTDPVASTTTAAFGALGETQAGGTGNFSGPLPNSLVFPFRLGIAPRLSFALRLPKQTVVRGGFGMNYTNSQYANFAGTMARQPMVNQPALVNEQTNIATTAGAFTLANGFPTPAKVGSYSVDPHYHLPYVEVWNIEIQKTLPWGVLMNVGYNGSKGNHLDITSAPRATVSSPNSDPGNLPFNYEQAAAFSKFNAGTLRLNKRLGHGLALGADYSIRIPSTTPDQWEGLQRWWRKTGRTWPPRKATPASTSATRSAGLTCLNCPLGRTSVGSPRALPRTSSRVSLSREVFCLPLVNR